MGAFFESLSKELNQLPDGFSPETIFIGGGTPTAPDLQSLQSIIPALSKFTPREFSVEVNPGTVDQAKFELLKSIGVTRLSIGVQSFNSDCLEILGRIHSAEDASSAFRRARAAGFQNISIDLMFGIPGQTMAMLSMDLDRALELGPEHVSIYNLMYEEGTSMADRTDRLDENLEREMYDRIRHRLKGAGFEQYEISNFAKTGFECAHNNLYWSGGEYIGCGPAAHSHWHGMRWANVSDLDDYIANGPRREFEEVLDPEAKARETVVMGLRKVQGVDVPAAVWSALEASLRALKEAGLLEIDGRHVRLTEEALFISDSVFAELV